MKFSYVAYNHREGLVRGHVEARNREEALLAVRRWGHRPLQVALPRRIPGLHSLLAGLTRVGAGELVRFSRQLATILTSGGNLMHALEMLQAESRNKVMRRTLAAIRQTLDEGGSLSSALKAHPLVFNPLFVCVVEVGEYTGRLGPALEHMAEILGKEHEVKQKAIRTLMYPLGVIGLSLVTLAVLMIVAMPPLLNTFRQAGADIPTMTRVAVALFGALRENLFNILLGVLLAGVGFALLRRVPRARYWLDATQARAPVLGPFIVSVELSRFCRTVAMLLEAEVALATALELGVAGCRNVVLKRAFAEAHYSLLGGHPLTEALKRHPIVPSLFVEMVTIGEESNSLRRTMGDAADAYQKQFEEGLASLIGIMEPVSTVAVGAIVAFIALSMFMPIYSGLDAIK
ncbi:MAG: type II secretion system F family protein [Chloroflexi bacterium]|nr:type II secretion system F family protein [Chloroflexota bacterium]